MTRKRFAWLGAGASPPLAGDFNLDDDFRQDAGLLAGVERVVDGFLDAGEQRLARVVEAQQMAVLGEELGDRDLALARAHLGCRYGRLRGGSLGVDRRSIGLWHGFRHFFFHISTGNLERME